MALAKCTFVAEADLRPLVEKPLTVFLNGLEIITVATTGERADCLALGYLITQGFLRADETVLAIDVEPDLDLAVVRTEAPTAHETFVKGRTLVSNCAHGTAIDRLLATLRGVAVPAPPAALAELSDLAATLAAGQERRGGLHVGGLWRPAGGAAVAVVHDHGRLAVLDTLAGLARRDGLDASDCLVWTSGRISAESVIKAAHLGAPALAGCGLVSDWAARLAAQVGLTLISGLGDRR